MLFIPCFSPCLATVPTGWLSRCHPLWVLVPAPSSPCSFSPTGSTHSPRVLTVSGTFLVPLPL